MQTPLVAPARQSEIESRDQDLQFSELRFSGGGRYHEGIRRRAFADRTPIAS
jgi:hypothetical protein